MTTSAIFSQMIRLARDRQTGGYEQIVLNGPVAVLDVAGQYDHARQLTRVQVRRRYPLTDRPPDTAGLAFADGKYYYAPQPDCWATFRNGMLGDLGVEFETWLQAPYELLPNLKPVRYDSYSLRLDATIPTKLAAVLLGGESFAPGFDLPLRGLRGDVPVSVRLASDGSFAELYLAGDDLVEALHGVTGVNPKALHYLGFVHAQITDQSADGSLAAPPADQVKSTIKACGSTAST